MCSNECHFNPICIEKNAKSRDQSVYEYFSGHIFKNNLSSVIVDKHRRSHESTNANKQRTSVPRYSPEPVRTGHGNQQICQLATGLIPPTQNKFNETWSTQLSFELAKRNYRSL